MNALRRWFWCHGANVAAITIPGLALCVPSGYSWGPVWLILCSFITIDQWGPKVPDLLKQRRWAALTSVVLLMMLMWWIDTGPHIGLNNFGTPAEYLLALPCLAFVLVAPPKIGSLCLGLAIGGIGGGIIALAQRYGLHIERAQGYTNVIQFGDISLLLGIMALTALALNAHKVIWPNRPRLSWAILAAGAILGMTGSLLSQSRGGWMTLPLIWLGWGVALWHGKLGKQGQRLFLIMSGSLISVVAVLTTLQLSQVENRIGLVHSQMTAYEQKGDADSSVGLRLASWHVALIMGRERPIMGWGRQFAAEKARLISIGQGDTSILVLDHAHNEWIDMFARRGIVGLVLLAAWFLVPILIFLQKGQSDLKNSAGVLKEGLFQGPQELENPGLNHLDKGPSGSKGPSDPKANTGIQNNLAFVIGTTALMLPIAYIGFGLTQVLFMHNSGHLVYLYGIVIFAGALNGVRALRCTHDREELSN